MFKKLLILGSALMLSACAVGNTYEYGDVVPALDAATDKAITVAVSDQRPYVVSGDKSPDFVGLQRAGFGNPWPVHTTSGAPLATELGTSIARSLNEKGASAEARTVAPGTTADQVSTDKDRLLFVSVKEWKTDVFAQVTLHWNLIADVADSTGTILATNRISGVEGVGAAQLETANSVTATANAERKLQELLNTPEISQALQ